MLTKPAPLAKLQQLRELVLSAGGSGLERGEWQVDLAEGEGAAAGAGEAGGTAGDVAAAAASRREAAAADAAAAGAGAGGGGEEGLKVDGWP